MKFLLLLPIACLAITGCISTRGEVWADTTPPRLQDANIVMRTTWETGGKPSIETRSATVADGVLTVAVDTWAGRREGTATASDWETLWATLSPVAPWEDKSLTPSTRDVSAGPYHLVSLRMGRFFNEWSAQSGAGFLGIQTQRSLERIKLTNAIYDFVESRATRETRKGPASKPTP